MDAERVGWRRDGRPARGLGRTFCLTRNAEQRSAQAGSHRQLGERQGAGQGNDQDDGELGPQAHRPLDHHARHPHRDRVVQYVERQDRPVRAGQPRRLRAEPADAHPQAPAHEGGTGARSQGDVRKAGHVQGRSGLEPSQVARLRGRNEAVRQGNAHRGHATAHQRHADSDQPRAAADDRVQQPLVGDQRHAHREEAQPQGEVGPVAIGRRRDAQQILAGEDRHEQDQQEDRSRQRGQPAQQTRTGGAPQRAKQWQAQDRVGQQERNEPQVHAVVAEPAHRRLEAHAAEEPGDGVQRVLAAPVNGGGQPPLQRRQDQDPRHQRDQQPPNPVDSVGGQRPPPQREPGGGAGQQEHQRHAEQEQEAGQGAQDRASLVVRYDPLDHQEWLGGVVDEHAEYHDDLQPVDPDEALGDIGARLGRRHGRMRIALGTVPRCPRAGGYQPESTVRGPSLRGISTGTPPVRAASSVHWLARCGAQAGT